MVVLSARSRDETTKDRAAVEQSRNIEQLKLMARNLK
jgi:hypothetical protein